MATSTPASVPTIFDRQRRSRVRARLHRRQQAAHAARFVLDDMIDDVLDRLDFLRHVPGQALVVGDYGSVLATALAARGAGVTSAGPLATGSVLMLDEEQPWRFANNFDLIVSLGTLDTVNDLPGALVHLRRALAPEGLAMISFPGAGSLPALRAVMLAADGERPAPRLHPQIDVRAGAQLLQRAGFADPVVDSRTLSVGYRSLATLVSDLRDQGFSKCLATPAPPLGKAGWHRAQAAFAAAADAEGRVAESFEILTLSGWAKPLRAPKF